MNSKRILTLILFFLPSFVFAEAPNYDVPKVIAIQTRNYRLGTELGLNISYLPMDSFTNYFSIGGSVTHYFSDYIAWEIVNGAYANSASTGLKEYISNNFGYEPESYDIMSYYFTTNVIYTPFYTKNLVFGSKIGYGDLSFVLGGGLSKYDKNNNVNTIDGGIILRYALSKITSLKFDFRSYFYLNGDLASNIAITVGFAYNFGSNSENKNEDNND